MNNSFKGGIYIFLGIMLTFFAAGEILFRAIIFCSGLYLIYSGLQLRNHNQILFYIHRFRNRF